MNNTSEFKPETRGTSAEILLITPELAKQMLARNNKNRLMRPWVVDNYAKSIKNGNWPEGPIPDAIAFDQDGVLVNGQHRLYAIIKANTPLKQLVAYGIQQNAYMDRGHRRNVSDNLTITKGKTYERQCVGIINGLNRIQKGENAPMDENSAGIMYDAIRSMLEKVFDMCKARGKMAYGVDYETAQLIMYWSGVPFDRIEHFHKVFVTGIPEDGSPLDSTIIKLRDDVLQGKGNFAGGGGNNRIKIKTYAYAQHLMAYYKGNVRPARYDVAVSFINENVDNIFKHTFSDVA